MYEELKERKSEGKLLKSEETKLDCIEKKLMKLYYSYNKRMAKTTERDRETD